MKKRTLPKNGIFLTSEDNQEFQNYFSQIYKTFYNEECEGQSIKAKSITFVVTEKCNLNCTYCYEKHSFHKNGKSMSKEVAKDAIDFILNDDMLNGYADSKKSPCLILDFIGGEPLLEIDLIEYICDYFVFKSFELNHPWANNYMFSICSNGLLFDTPKVKKFLEKHGNKTSFNITIDGNKELHDSCRLLPNGKGSYDIVEKSFQLLIDKYNGNSTKLTIAPGNITHVFDATKHLWDMGAQFVNENCIYEEGWDYSHAKELYKQMKLLADFLLENNNYQFYYSSLFNEHIGGKVTQDKNYCGGNGEMLAIGPDGVCYPCLRFMQHSMKSDRPEFICGNIYDGLMNPQEDERLCKLCSITLSSQSDDKCKNCPISSECGLCTAYNYDKFGDPNKRATYICVMHQARVLANIYYWNKLYLKNNIYKRIPINIPKEWALNIIDENEFNTLINLSRGDIDDIKK